MENTKQDLYKESLSARINRLEQTIRELKNLNDMLIKGQEIDRRHSKDLISLRDKKIIKQQEEIETLQDYILKIKNK